MLTDPFTLEDIYAARETIKGVAFRTPIYSSSIFRRTGFPVYLKLECFQPTRSFKLRGATNKIKNCPSGKMIVTASSGNHGFAVSYVCMLLGRRATVCVPETANPDKVRAIAECGAELVKVGRNYEDAYQQALRICQTNDGIMVHPYEDPLVMAGQGTVGLEIFEDRPDVNTVVVPIGGGGLICGTALAVKNLKKSVRVIGVQSENAPSMAEAFRHGAPITTIPSATLADGMIVKCASEVTLMIVRQYVDEIVLVSDSDLEHALLGLLKEDHILVEPSGAASLAAILSGRLRKAQEETVAVVSGGNISIDYLSKLLGKSL